MGYLNNSTRTLDAILTRKGREMLARGQQININKFALGDDEVDYALWDTSHQSGTDYYGAVIENLPFLEPFDDPDTIMKYKLVTRSSGTKKMITLDGPTTGATTISLNWNSNHASSESPNATYFWEGTVPGAPDRSYIFTKPHAGWAPTTSTVNTDSFNNELYSITILDSSVCVLGPTTTSGEGGTGGNYYGLAANAHIVIPGPNVDEHTIGTGAFGEVQNVTQTINDVDTGVSDRWVKIGTTLALYGQELTSAQSPAKTKIIVTGQDSGAVLEYNITIAYA